ncbi:LuxR family transcriptional regulator [Pseudonocardiaceae bacterium YIM PH 21723]|nr:LuxR family transcriptional regulator [Pseudonocardiaceae bacterium YIM PH 21723]
MIGRDQELVVLTEAVRCAPSLIVLEGPPGIGKTRLVGELLRLPSVTGRRVLRGQCHPVAEPFPLGPVIEALSAMTEWERPLGRVAGALHTVLPELSELLPAPLPGSTDLAIARHQIFRGIRELLDAVGPVLLVLEDLHWMDRTTFELLTFLARFPVPRLALLLTCRPDEAAADRPLADLADGLSDRRSWTRVELDCLTSPEVALLAGELLGGVPIPADLAVDLHELTAGLPYAVEEVASVLRTARGDLPARLDGLRVPDGIREHQRARQSALAAAVGRSLADDLLEGLAVLGRPAGILLLAALTGAAMDVTAEAVGQAMHHGLLRRTPSGDFDFRHPLARQSVAESLSVGRLAEVHATVATALAASAAPPCAEVARHRQAAGDTAGCTVFAERAADEAMARGDVSTAREMLALGLTDPGLSDEDLVRLAGKFGAAVKPGMPDASTMAVLRTLIGEPRLPADIRRDLRLEFALLMRHFNDTGYAELERVVEELTDRPARQARVMAALAIPDWAPGPVSGQLAWMDRAVALLPRIEEPADRAGVLFNEAFLRTTVGDPRAPELVAGLPTEANTTGQRQELVRGWLNQADLAHRFGDLPLATRALAMADRSMTYEATARQACAAEAVRAWADWFGGRWPQLESRLTAIDREYGPPTSLLHGQAAALRGGLALARGDAATAEQCLRDVLAADPATAMLPVRALAAALLSRCLHGQRRIDEARLVVHAELDRIRAKGVWCYATDLIAPAVGLLAIDELVRAELVCEEFAAGTAAHQAPVLLPVSADAQARLAERRGDLDAAIAQYSAAATGFRKLHRPYEAAQAEEAVGRCLLTAGHKAGEQVTAALRHYEELGATWDVSRCRSVLRRYGLLPANTRGRRGYGAQLSPREREVAELAALGRSNREIATALYVSERTVEEHVSKAIRKLGITSRRDFARVITP